MAERFPTVIVLDENVMATALADGIQQAARDIDPSHSITMLRIGDEGAPPRMSSDETVADWAIESGYWLATLDANTMIDIYSRLWEERPKARPLLVLPNGAQRLGALARAIALAALALEPGDVEGPCYFISRLMLADDNR